MIIVNKFNLLLILVVIAFSSCRKDDSGPRLKDEDGNSYPYVTIGDQIWMSTNLNTTKYNDGTTIPWVPDNDEWNQLAGPGFTWYNNDKATNEVPYGALYNWYVVETGKLCPIGWHVPSESEWVDLIVFLGAEGNSGTEGYVLKTTTGWITDGNGTDQYGFSAYPGGGRNNSINTFFDLGANGYWWSTTATSPSEASGFNVIAHALGVGVTGVNKQLGYSVRCIRD